MKKPRLPRLKPRPSGPAADRVADPAHDRHLGAVDRAAARARRLCARSGAGLRGHQQFRFAARLCADRDDRLVRDRPGRRGPVQPPARGPALPRTLFGPLLPDFRWRQGPVPVALALGPAPQRRRPYRHRRPLLRQQRIPEREIADRRARRAAAGLAGALALPGRAKSRRARRADRRAAPDHGALVRRARPRAHPARRDPGGLRPLAAAPGPPRDRRDPLGPQVADRGKAAARDRAAARGIERAARP